MLMEWDSRTCTFLFVLFFIHLRNSEMKEKKIRTGTQERELRSYNTYIISLACRLAIELRIDLKSTYVPFPVERDQISHTSVPKICEIFFTRVRERTGKKIK